ncbi:MAG: hypothetical protein LBT50_08580 [Prevotellaceae bacterium]|jgi:hypothetical protein|nr:hypothetical protein [Prevotellaceae bacterium]
MIQKIIICLFTQMLVCWCAVGQQNYKNIYESIKTMKDYEAFQVLFAYQSATTSKDFVNVNGYYQMGLITQKMMRQYDPFLQPQNTEQSISDTKTYLSLALHYFTEKEAKNNGKYYQDSPSPQTYENIKKDMESRISDVKEYEKYFKQNRLYLTESILKYNTCIETFTKINEQNSRLNDLYFLADNTLKQNLKILQENFDSTLYYVEKLKSSLENYSMSGYKVNYLLSPVSVYRLHGLSAANFIAKEVILWDFTSWVNSFQEVLNADVAFLYKKAGEEHKVNLENISKLKRSQKTSITADYTVDPVVINKIYKYDFNSVVAPLLKYQEEKIRFLYHDVDNVIDNRLVETNNFAKSNSYYYDLITKKKLADSALNLTVAKVAPEAVKKYSAFFESNYKDIEGFKTYLQNEAKDNDQLLKTALNTYKDNVWNALSPSPAKTITYNGEQLFASIILPDSLRKSGYFIHSKSVLPGKKIFVAGSYVNPQLEIVAFAALLDELSEIEWLKTFDKSEGKSYGVLTCESDNGFAVVVAANNGTESANQLYLLDNGGNVKKNVKLPSTAIPRKLMYDDISQTFLLAFKGNSFMPYAVSADELSLYRLNADLSLNWQSNLPFTGYILNVIKTNDRFYVHGAYKAITDGGKTVSTADNKVNAFVYTVSSTGERLSLKTFDAPFSYYPLLATKINNEYVDLISVKASPDGLPNATNESFYMIISSENEALYEL